MVIEALYEKQDTFGILHFEVIYLQRVDIKELGPFLKASIICQKSKGLMVMRIFLIMAIFSIYFSSAARCSFIKFKHPFRHQGSFEYNFFFESENSKGYENVFCYGSEQDKT